MCQNAQVIVCMLNKRIVNILPWVYRVDIHMDRHTVIHMWSRWTCKAFLQILSLDWNTRSTILLVSYWSIRLLTKLSSTNRIQTNLTLIIVFVLAGGLPFAPSGGSQQPLWWQKTTLEADNKCRFARWDACHWGSACDLWKLYESPMEDDPDGLWLWFQEVLQQGFAMVHSVRSAAVWP